MGRLSRTIVVSHTEYIGPKETTGRKLETLVKEMAEHFGF